MSLIAGTTLELQDPANGIDFYIVKGGLDDIPVVRGEDIPLPGKAGLTHGVWIEDHLNVVLHGYVEGQGATAAAQRVSYLTLMNSLKAVFDPTADPFNLVAHGGAPRYNEGLTTGQTGTIAVRFLRFTGPAGNGLVREFDIECKAISDPPTWAVAP